MAQAEETRSQIAKFCKERDAIVKRANQICTLCASRVAIICFSMFGQMYVSGDENIIDTYEEETTVAPRCTFRCTIHKTPRIFKLKKWRNKNNNSCSSSSSRSKMRGQNKTVKSPISLPKNEFIHELNLPDQPKQLLEKMGEFKDSLVELRQFLTSKENVLESSDMAKDWLKL